jgi:hypothetical protein
MEGKNQVVPEEPGKIGYIQQLEKNVECFKYLGSILTNDGRCTREIKFRIAMAKAAFNKKKTPFTSKLELIEEEISKILHLERGFVWC